MGGGRYLQSKSMRFYSLNIKTKGHLLLPKIAWFLSYLMLKSGPYHFILGDVNLLIELFIHTENICGFTHQILDLKVM